MRSAFCGRTPSLVRGALVAAATAMAAAFGAPAAAAPGVDPTIVSRNADQGSSFVVDKTAHTPEIPPNPDVVLLVDTTGSMGGAIANVQANLHQVVTDVRAAQPTAQFAVASYKDTTDGGCDADFFAVHQDLTSDEAAVQAAVDGLSAFGGCDTPEDWIFALHQVATGAVTFRADSSRIIVLVGDASSHDPSNGVSLGTAIAALQAASARVVGVNVDSGGADGLDAVGQATAVVDATGGSLTTSDPDAVSAAILAGLANLPVTVTPVPVCDLGLSATFAPASQTVPSGSDALFTETVTVAADARQGADLQCTVDFTLNGAPGGPAFVQTISVHVNDTTPPVVTVDDRTVEATSPAGAVVDYPASAIDNVDGPLTPTCAPPSGDTFPIGDTTVTCTATDAAGNTGSDTAVMRVVDTTAPTTACTPTTNPSGSTIPPADDTNPDGFYELTVQDIADPDAVVWITDTANPSVMFGPYPTGTTIKLVQAPGATPDVKPGTGAIDWKVTLNGDAVIVGMDRYGNSSTATCLVPPAPR